MKKLTLFLAIFITKLAIAASGIGVVALRYDKSRSMTQGEYRDLIKSYTVPGFIAQDNTLLYNTAILNATTRVKIVDGTRQFLVARFNAIHAAKNVSAIVTLDNLDYYLSLCVVRKNVGASKWSLISKIDWSSQANEFPRSPYNNEDILYYLEEKVASLDCGNVNQDEITSVSSSKKYEESMKGSTPPPPTSITGNGSVPPPPANIASGSIPPPPASMTTCPPPTPKCNDYTASNSSKDKKDDEQTKLLKSINQKLTWGLIIGGADLFIDGFHLIWDMTRGEYVASNGGGTNPAKKQGGLQDPSVTVADTNSESGNPFSGGGDTQ